MKTLGFINKIVFSITITLYLTVILGLYAQIVLSIVQVLSSFSLIIIWKALQKRQQRMLFFYWALVTSYGLCWLIDWNSLENTMIFFTGLIIVPLSIAVYFIILLNKISQTNTF